MKFVDAAARQGNIRIVCIKINQTNRRRHLPQLATREHQQRKRERDS